MIAAKASVQSPRCVCASCGSRHHRQPFAPCQPDFCRANHASAWLSMRRRLASTRAMNSLKLVSFCPFCCAARQGALATAVPCEADRRHASPLREYACHESRQRTYASPTILDVTRDTASSPVRVHRGDQRWSCTNAPAPTSGHALEKILTGHADAAQSERTSSCARLPNRGIDAQSRRESDIQRVSFIDHRLVETTPYLLAATGLFRASISSTDTERRPACRRLMRASWSSGPLGKQRIEFPVGR